MRSYFGKLKIHLFQLPRETAQDLPKVSLRGRDELLLSHHHGVVRFEPQCLCVHTSLGDICIRGESFSIESIGADLLRLRGQIRCVSMEEKHDA